MSARGSTTYSSGATPLASSDANAVAVSFSPTPPSGVFWVSIANNGDNQLRFSFDSGDSWGDIFGGSVVNVPTPMDISRLQLKRVGSNNFTDTIVNAWQALTRGAAVQG
jgi:hypothetical protein